MRSADSGGPRIETVVEASVWEPTERWTTADAGELYDVASWGKGYFSVGDNGHRVGASHQRTKSRHRSCGSWSKNWNSRGISLPILIRFAEILKHRLGELHQAFQSSIAEHGYQGGYCCVYPIKVNQQRQVVEEVFQFGRPYQFGLEAGSKPELLAVLAIADNETPIICNGFKDDEYIEMVMLAQKIGRQIIPVVEKYTELDLIMKHSAARRRAARDRVAREAGQPRIGPLEVFRRISLEVRTDGQRGAAGAGADEGAAEWKIASSFCTSISAARSRISGKLKPR